MDFSHSQEAFVQGKRFIPDGLLRLGQDRPFYIDRAKGARLYDIDGNEFIDYTNARGRLITGHLHSDILAALEELMMLGTNIGLPTNLELMLAEMVVNAYSGVEMVRFCNTESEAILDSIRVARFVTGREIVVMPEAFATTEMQFYSELVEDVQFITDNSIDALRQIFDQRGEEIAAVILEPISTRHGLVLHEKEYLQEFRRLTRNNGSLLIFDEITSGFRIAYGGAQEVYGIEADLTCLGKILGGGFPLAALGGKSNIMSQMSSANQYNFGQILAIGSGIATLRLLQNPGVYDHLWLLGKRLADGINQNLQELEIPCKYVSIGSMFNLYFIEENLSSFRDIKESEVQKYFLYYQAMLEKHICLPSIQDEVGFFSLAHTESEIDQTIETNFQVLQQIFYK